MIAILARLLSRGEPALSEAGADDAAAVAALHGASFRHGWSEDEVESLLTDRSVYAHRAVRGRRLVGFILSRVAAGEAEILSVAIAELAQGPRAGRPPAPSASQPAQQCRGRRRLP